MPPPITAGLQYQWDASELLLSDGAAVNSWTDLIAGKVMNAGVNVPEYETPSLNGMGGVKFVGTDSMTASGLALDGTQTFFAVLKNPPNDGGNKSTFGRGGYMIFQKWTNNNRFIFGRSQFSFIEFTEAGIAGQQGYWTLRYQATGANIRWNGASKQTGNFAADTSSQLDMGHIGGDGATASDCTIYELLVYDSVLSDTDVATIEAYLNQKWFVAPPTPPTDVAATGISETEILITWTDSAVPDDYRIERSADGLTGWTALDTVAAGIESYLDDGLECGQTWYYRIIGIVLGIESDPSDVVSASTDSCPNPIIVPNPTPGNFWLTDPRCRLIPLCPVSTTWTRTRPFGSFQPIDGGVPTVVTGAPGLRDYTLTLAFDDLDDFYAFEDFIAQPIVFLSFAGHHPDQWCAPNTESYEQVKINEVRVATITFVGVEPEPQPDPESFFS